MIGYKFIRYFQGQSGWAALYQTISKPAQWAVIGTHFPSKLFRTRDDAERYIDQVIRLDLNKR